MYYPEDARWWPLPQEGHCLPLSHLRERSHVAIRIMEIKVSIEGIAVLVLFLL